MQDPATLMEAAQRMGGAGDRDRGGPEIGACFQLALLAAGQGNDKEAGDYLRQIIVGLKGRVRLGGSDAAASPPA